MNPYLYPGLELGPRILHTLLRAIPTEHLDKPTSPGRFSVREVVAHLNDWEPILRGRIHQTCTDPGCTLIPQDEGLRAIEMEYESSDVHQQMEEFIARRAETIAFLKSLAAEDWNKTAQHPERGVMSVSDQANMFLGHDLYHIEQLAGTL